jgi:hypothetical protein
VAQWDRFNEETQVRADAKVYYENIAHGFQLTA